MHRRHTRHIHAGEGEMTYKEKMRDQKGGARLGMTVEEDTRNNKIWTTPDRGLIAPGSSST